jgi:hypothetical protein
MSMSSKPNRKAIAELQATSTQAKTGEVSLGNSTRDEEIRRRAYEIYLERGEQPGRELDDWLQAERGLKRGMFLNPKWGSATADIDRLRLLNCHGHQSRSPHDFCDPFGRIGRRADSRRSLEQS